MLDDGCSIQLAHHSSRQAMGTPFRLQKKFKYVEYGTQHPANRREEVDKSIGNECGDNGRKSSPTTSIESDVHLLLFLLIVIEMSHFLINLTNRS